MSALCSPGGLGGVRGHRKGKLELCGDDGKKIWEQLHWKATLVGWEQPEGLSPSPGVSHHAGEVWDSAGTTGLRGQEGSWQTSLEGLARDLEQPSGGEGCSKEGDLCVGTARPKTRQREGFVLWDSTAFPQGHQITGGWHPAGLRDGQSGG